MQICRYDNSVKLSISAHALNKAIHPLYNEEQLARIQPHLLKVLRTCKRHPFQFRGVSIVADNINSWYTVTGSFHAVSKFFESLLNLELTGAFLIKH